MNDLAGKYTEWLAEHCEPQRTLSGRIRTRRGVKQYRLPDDMAKLLGGSVVGPAERMRSGDDVPRVVRTAVRELVDAWTLKAIYTLRRDQALAQALRFAIRRFEESGRAPDGGNLREWATSKRDRLDEDVFGVDAPLGGDAGRLWDRVFSRQIAPANQRRRQRHRSAA